MWIAYSKKGTKIQTAYWDWTCMYKIITDYQEELGLLWKDACNKFWEDLKNYNPKKYDEILSDFDSLEEALGYGSLDDLREEYLQLLNIECVRAPINKKKIKEKKKGV